VALPKLFPSLPNLDSLAFERKTGEFQPSIEVDLAANPDDDSPEAIAWLHVLESPVPQSKGLFWGTMALALGLHLVLGFISTGDEAKAPPTNPQEKKVRIVQLPMPGQPIAKAAPLTPARPTPPARSPIQRPATNRPPVRPAQRPIVQRPRQTPPPATTPPATTAPATTAPATTAPPATGANPWQDFPQYPGAKPGCFNLQSCLSTGKSLAEVSQFFQKELTARKYSVQPANGSTNGGTVLQVSRDGLTQFLSILNAEELGAIYVLSEQPVSLGDLTKAIEVPNEIYSVLSGLAAEDATAAQFAQPNDFFPAGTVRSEIAAMKFVAGEDPATFFDAYFRTNLVNNGFDPQETNQQYGGGFVYRVKKASLVLYLNLVPTADNSGTIVVVWRVAPQ